jgi:hypothetical protein
MLKISINNKELKEGLYSFLRDQVYIFKVTYRVNSKELDDSLILEWDQSEKLGGENNYA